MECRPRRLRPVKQRSFIVNPLLTRLDVAVLFVADLQRGKSFYQDTLGLKVHFEDDTSVAFNLDPVLLILLTIDSARDLLTSDAVASPPRAGAASQLVSFVADVDAVYAELSGKGVEFVREPMDREWGLRTAHFKDPDGNIWEIAHSLEKGAEG
jgi:catechol 2,3-dioxygenase-like lactoylglutathione lyase family enzyme